VAPQHTAYSQYAINREACHQNSEHSRCGIVMQLFIRLKTVIGTALYRPTLLDKLWLTHNVIVLNSRSNALTLSMSYEK